MTGPQWAEELASPSASRRRAAARVLARHGDADQAVEALIEALRTERDGAVRKILVRALARRGDAAAVPVLIRALGAGDDASRRAVALALGALGTRPALRALVDALAQPTTAPFASVALERAGSPAVPLLIGAMSSDSVAPAVADVLGRLGDPAATAPLLAWIDHPQPAVRVAAVRALGRLGDDRAVRAVVARVDDDVDEVRVAALEALGALGGPAEVPLLADYASSGPEGLRRVALRALLRVAPGRAAVWLAEALEAGPPPDDPVRMLVLGASHPALVPLLQQLLSEGDDRAADTLARIDRGQGLSALCDAVGAPEQAPASPAVVRALAVGLRRWERVPDLPRTRARTLLEGVLAPQDERAWVLGGLARIPAARTWAVRGLSSVNPGQRASAAHALALMGARGERDVLVEIALNEPDSVAFAGMVRAALALGARAPLGALWPALRRTETAPDAMLLAAASLEGALPRPRRAVRELLRRGLRAEDPRVRATAARALAEAGDGGAWRAIAQRLDDPAPEVRVAAARALGVLGRGPAEASPGPALQGRLRVEDDPWVRGALGDAVRAGQGQRPGDFSARGEEVLRVRVASEGERGRVTVDVVLPDGRWLRLSTLATGELFLADLPAATADVRVRVGGGP
jgi:HEAT repeat protein